MVCLGGGMSVGKRPSGLTKTGKLLGIFGDSGFAREVADIGYELGYQPIYVLQNEAQLPEALDTEYVLYEGELDEWSEIDFAIGIGNNSLREKVVSRYGQRLHFINLIHPTVSMGQLQINRIQPRRGIILCSGVRLTNNIEIGNFSILNLNSTVGHDTIIGEFVNVSPGANISGNVLIEKDCLIGTGAAINQGTPEKKLRIGQNTTIGSGAVVVKDCDENAVYVGSPARRIK